MELFLIYLWLKLDSFITALVLFAGIGVFAYIAGWLPRSIEEFDRDEKGTMGYKFCYWHTKLILLISLSTVLSLLVPSSKEVAILVASSVAIDVAKSPEGTKIGQLLRGKANEILDTELQKLSPKK